ncbi:MAG TPA: SpoIIIAH-like family protein [Candidatus Flavonifractor merdigallinarum]|uniref:SpoIIIAH-like family protein n=1 Tax=Candidatus Flavonifractor merdigallinarum TaxID=2838589 RepID=A0A9D1Y8E3_9FIRM|nr:SpoIIIAH-like family protein [Candidatus Flavonifractor merdigallinarum]
MKLWKRNAVVAVIVLFVCVAVYLNWSYNQESADAGKVLGQAALVGAESTDPLLAGTASSATPAPSGSVSSPAPSGQAEQTAGEGESGGTGYFASARLNRQEARDSALRILQESAADETMQAEMTQAIETMADTTVSEAQIENMVTAKGYADCVAFLGEDSASIVVAATAEGLSDADIARITEIVTGETGLSASQIRIIEAEP